MRDQYSSPLSFPPRRKHAKTRRSRGCCFDVIRQPTVAKSGTHLPTHYAASIQEHPDPDKSYDAIDEIMFKSACCSSIAVPALHTNFEANNTYGSAVLHRVGDTDESEAQFSRSTALQPFYSVCDDIKNGKSQRRQEHMPTSDDPAALVSEVGPVAPRAPSCMSMSEASGVLRYRHRVETW